MQASKYDRRDILDVYFRIFFNYRGSLRRDRYVAMLLSLRKIRIVTFLHHERENEFYTSFSSFVSGHVLCKFENDAVP